MDRYECYSLVVNVAGIAILAVYTFFTFRLFRQSQEQTKKAQQQIELSQRQIEISADAVKIQHLLNLVTQFGTEPLAVARKSLARKRLAGDPEPPEMQDILDFFETIGFLVKRDYLIARDVWDMFSYWLFNVFADFKSIIEEEQKHDPSYYQDFSKLIEQLRKIEYAEGCSDDNPSLEDVEEFWKDEVAAKSGTKASRSGMKKRPKRR